MSDLDVALTDMYSITMAEMKPTPMPQIRRPGTIRPMLVDAVSRIQPTVKTIQPAMMIRRRPKKSARSPAAMAPKKVPAVRIDVTRDWVLAGITKSLSSASVVGYGLFVYR
jgi:hypothetical protein